MLAYPQIFSIMTSLMFLGTWRIVAVGGSLKWLALNKVAANSAWGASSVCSKANGLTGQQVRFCKKNFQWMKVLKESSQETKDECQELFKHRKWNCLSVNKAPQFDSDISEDTKETGFLYALSSAVLALSVARTCMAGNIPDCACSRGYKQLSLPSEVLEREKLSYIDSRLHCRGVIKYGQNFSYKFINMGLRRKVMGDSQVLEIAVRKHNVRVGLEALNDAEEIACVCNGATAGCAVKYCYRRHKQIQEVAEILVKRYESAVQVKLSSLAGIADLHKGNDLTDDSLFMGDADRRSIAYLTESEELCSSGKTSRRRCEIEDTKPNSCRRLCCGKGYREKLIDVVTQCNCKFTFCCKVECQTCTDTKTTYECL